MDNLTGIEKWRELDGDNTLALDWDLNENSHVWEIGGFEGRWAEQIWNKFHCYITIFEPQMWAVMRMYEWFEGIEKIDIRPYGLWTESKNLTVGNYQTDGTSVFSDKEPTGVLEFRDVCTEIINAGSVDLALMNVEGSEYNLIPEIVEFNLMGKFRQFWCQFHPGLIGVGDGNTDYMADEIYYQMNKTHDLLWDCYPTAVAWKRK